MGIRFLYLVIYMVVGLLQSFPVRAQSDSEADFLVDNPPAAYYVGSSVADIARAALEQRNISLATKLIHIFEATPDERIFLGELAVSQAEASDWPGSDHTLSLLPEHYARAYVLSHTASLLIKQNQRQKAISRLIESWREAVQVRHPLLQPRVLRWVTEEAIRARYTILIPIALDRFEIVARGDLQDYAPALCSFSRLQAENGNIDEAIRLYNRIPAEARTTVGLYERQEDAISSPRPAIAAAYLRAGNADAFWNLYAGMTATEEKQQTLLELANAAIQYCSPRDAKPLLERIFQAADALPKIPRRLTLIALLIKLRYPGPLFSTFADLRRYRLSAEEEAGMRIELGSSYEMKSMREACWWLAPVPRIIAHIPDEPLRLNLTVSYAYALLTAGVKAEGLRLLQKMVEVCLQIPSARNRIEMLERIASEQARWKDTTRQLQTDRLLLQEMHDNPLDWSPGIFPELINRLVRVNRREEAVTALNLLKQFVDRSELRSGKDYGFRGEIAYFEKEIEAARHPSPEYERPVALSEALLIKDDKERAQELESCVFQRLQNHQIKKALQVLPHFPITDDQRNRLKQELGLR